MSITSAKTNRYSLLNDPEQNLLSEVTIKPPGLPGYMGPCFNACLLASGAFSREEKVCLMDCYSKSSFHRPQRILL